MWFQNIRKWPVWLGTSSQPHHSPSCCSSPSQKLSSFNDNIKLKRCWDSYTPQWETWGGQMDIISTRQLTLQNELLPFWRPKCSLFSFKIFPCSQLQEFSLPYCINVSQYMMSNSSTVHCIEELISLYFLFLVQIRLWQRQIWKRPRFFCHRGLLLQTKKRRHHHRGRDKRIRLRRRGELLPKVS